MKILLLTPDVPYPSESGAAIRNFGIIRGLCAAGHELTLLSFADKPVDPETNPLYALCSTVHTLTLPRHSKLRRIIRLLTSNTADMEFRLQSPAFESALRSLLQSQEYDLIQFSGIELGGYLPLIMRHRKGAKVIYDALNAEAELQRVVASVDRIRIDRLPAALYSTIQARRLTRFERDICSTVDAVVAVSDEDRAFLKLYGGSPLFVVSNGIDAADYRPPENNIRHPCQLVFSGKMDYRPNVDAIEWFGNEILPRVQERFPLVELVIVGRNPHRRIDAFAADEHVRITGWVDSVEPYLHAATIFIVPLRMGSGTRLKILQAMAASCAVVSTSIGAAGLNAPVRAALEIADGAEDFAQTIIALLEDERRRSELGDRARERVSQYYDWSALIPQLQNVYREIGLG